MLYGMIYANNCPLRGDSDNCKNRQKLQRGSQLQPLGTQVWGFCCRELLFPSFPPCITTASVDKEPTYFLDLLRPTNDIAQLYKTRPCCPQLLLEKRVSQNKVNGKELGLTGGLWSTTRGFQIPCFQTYSNLRRKRHYYYYLRGKEMSIVPEMRVMVLMQATFLKLTIIQGLYLCQYNANTPSYNLYNIFRDYYLWFFKRKAEV